MSDNLELTPAGPSRQQRGIRLPQLLLSLLVVAIFALLAVWWQASTTSRTAALALANDVEVGVPLSRVDLTTIYMNTDVPSQYEDPQFADVFVGVSPVTDLEAGTIITASMFRRSTALGPNEALVGLRLSADEAPSGLNPGDAVQIIGPGQDEQVEILAADARVEAVAVSTDGTATVRLRLGIPDAQRVQLSADEVVVIEVDNSATPSWLLDEETDS